MKKDIKGAKVEEENSWQMCSRKVAREKTEHVGLVV